MKFGFGKSVLFMSMAALASAMFARGFVSVFQYDIFDSCINDPEAATTYLCRNANDLLQVGTFAFGALVFFGVLYVFWRNTEQNRRSIIHAALLSVAFFGLMIANWKIIIGLQDNFFEFIQFNRGIPERATEYGYLLLNRLGDVLAGVILGVAAWLPNASDPFSIDASKRKEPRLELTSAKNLKPAAKKKAPARKPSARKAPAKKK